MKTKKKAVALAVALWAVLGGLVFGIVRDIQAEARLDRQSALVGRILREENRLTWGPHGLHRWKHRQDEIRWEAERLRQAEGAR